MVPSRDAGVQKESDRLLAIPTSPRKRQYGCRALMGAQLAQIHPVVVSQCPLHGGLHLVRWREDGQLVICLHEAIEAASDDVDPNASPLSLAHVGDELWRLG